MCFLILYIPTMIKSCLSKTRKDTYVHHEFILQQQICAHLQHMQCKTGIKQTDPKQTDPNLLSWGWKKRKRKKVFSQSTMINIYNRSQSRTSCFHYTNNEMKTICSQTPANPVGLETPWHHSQVILLPFFFRKQMAKWGSQTSCTLSSSTRCYICVVSVYKGYATRKVAVNESPPLCLYL